MNKITKDDSVNGDEALVDCQCPPHRSALGPAAYLAELYQELGKVSENGSAPFWKDVFDEQRPDIENLELNRKNTEILIPEIDLANELLEARVALAPASWTTYTGHQTVGAQEKVIATPEHSTPSSSNYNAWPSLTQAFSPQPLPYDQPLDVTRSYLHALAAGRYETMKAFLRDVSDSADTGMLREPDNEDLVWEYLGFSAAEKSLFTVADNANELHRHFAYPAAQTDAQVEGELTSVIHFLNHTGLTAEEFDKLVNEGGRPNWLPLVSNYGSEADDAGCLLATAKVGSSKAAGVYSWTTAVLHRLHRYLRLWRKLGGTIEQFAVLNRLVKSLNLYVSAAGNAFNLNPNFFKEWAALRRLCERLGSADMRADRVNWQFRNEGLAYAGAGEDERRKLLAAVFRSLNADPQGTIDQLGSKRLLLLEQLFGGSLQTIVSSLRQVQMIQAIVLGRIAPEVLCHLLCGRHAGTILGNLHLPRENPYDHKQAFLELNRDYANRPVTMDASNASTVEAELGDFFRGDAAGVTQRMQAIMKVIHRQYQLVVATEGTAAETQIVADIITRFGKPNNLAGIDHDTVIENDGAFYIRFTLTAPRAVTIFLKEDPTENKVCNSLMQMFRAYGQGGLAHPAYIRFREKAAAIYNQIRADIESLAELLPNQRAARIALLDLSLSPGQRYGFVLGELRRLKAVVVEHFAKVIRGAAERAGRVLESAESKSMAAELIFRQISSPQNANPPPSIWRDFKLIRGEGLVALFQEIPFTTTPPPSPGNITQVTFTRRDADLNFSLTDAQGNVGWTPHGWRNNTPDPGKIPVAHVFKPGNMYCHTLDHWWGIWRGYFYMPIDGHVRFGVDLAGLPHGGGITDRCGILVNINGAPVIQDQWHIHPKNPSQSDAIQLPAGFVSIEVKCFSINQDQLSGVARVNLYRSDFSATAAGTGAATIPVDEGFYFDSPVWDGGTDRFAASYSRLWKACYYVGAFDVTLPEVKHLQPRAVWEPARPSGSTAFPGIFQATTVYFDLNHLGLSSPNNNEIKALSDQAERVAAYTAFRRRCVKPGDLLPNVTVAANNPATLNVPADQAQPVVQALAACRGWDLTLLHEALVFASAADPNQRLNIGDFLNEKWLLRVEKSMERLSLFERWWLKAGDTAATSCAALRKIAAGDTTAHTPMLRAWLKSPHDTELTNPNPLSDLTQIHDVLRATGQRALLAYLSVSRGAAPGLSASELSQSLLTNVAVVGRSRISRVQAAIVAIQRFVADRLARMSKTTPLTWSTTVWPKLKDYKAWEDVAYRNAYPENFAFWKLSSHPDNVPSLAFREFQALLRRGGLSLRAVSKEEASPLSLLERLEHLLPPGSGPRGTDWVVSKFEPGPGWIMPTPPHPPEKHPWRPGPHDMRGAVCFQLGDDLHLFWTVPVRDWDHENRAGDYSEPGAILDIKSQEAHRLAWGRLMADSEVWELVRMSDDWVVSPRATPVLTVTSPAAGEIEVQVEGASGYDGWLLRTATHEIVLSRISLTFEGVGGLPPKWLPPRELSGTVLPVGLTTRELRYLYPVWVSQELLTRGEYEQAREWLTFILPLSGRVVWKTLETTSADACDVVLRHLELLLQWGDVLYLSNKPENLQKADVLYSLVEEALGPHPKPAVCAELPQPLPKVGNATATSFESTLNPRLLRLWSMVEERQRHLRHFASIRGRVRALQRRAGDFFTPTESEVSPWSDPHGVLQPVYRFRHLLARAEKSVASLVNFSSALLAAMEKRDAEHLAILRASQESQIAHRLRDEREAEWRLAENEWRVLRQNHTNTEFRRDFFDELLNGGLNSGEISHLTNLGISLPLLASSQIMELLGQSGSFVMTTEARSHAQGLASGASLGVEIISGQRLATGFQLGARALQTVCTILNTQASIDATQGGHDRRARQWRHDRDDAQNDMTALKLQIDAAFKRMRIAREKLNTQDQQWAHSARVERYLRNKKTSALLYDWMRIQLLTLTRQTYRVARQNCEAAQRAYQYERYFSTTDHLPSAEWDHFRDGLLAGESLQLGLNKLEAAHDNDRLPESPQTLDFSLRKHAPGSLLSLRLTGACEFEIPEWLHDLGNPGQYCRRIKSIHVTVACPVGPLETVNCMLTSLSNITRISSDVAGGYQSHAMGNDPRLVQRFGASRAIVTTTGQDDTGTDTSIASGEMYGPFEGMGACGWWRLELPDVFHAVDPDELTDVVVRITYTALEGGVDFASAASAAAREMLPATSRPGSYVINLRTDAPAEWARLANASADDMSCSFQVDPSMLFLARRDRSAKVLDIELVTVIVAEEKPDIVSAVLGIQGQMHEIALMPVSTLPGCAAGVLALPASSSPVVTRGAPLAVSVKLKSLDAGKLSGMFLHVRYARL